MNIATIIGTRPEIIKLSQIIKELDKHYNQILIHTGQNYDYELNQVFFEDLGIRRPDHYLNVAGKHLGESIGNIISNSYELLERLRPDAVLVYGDTNSCLSVISAKRLKIPVFHLEAGNRSFDENVPEELNRRIVDHISDINFTLTEHARQYLLQEGIKGDRIIKTGGFMREIILTNLDKIKSSAVLKNLNLEKNSYFVASLHREENVDNREKLLSLTKCLAKIHQDFQKPIVFSCHPRTRKRLNEFDLPTPAGTITSPPFSLFDYLALQQNSMCVISDSGTITEESDVLGFPAVSPRLSHERPEGFDVGVIMLTNLVPDRVVKAIKVQLEEYSDYEHKQKIYDYSMDRPSITVAKAIGSYIDYINRNVWGL